ncbi:luciferin sulfotransferase [Dendroctonus ponderosae]|uniref:Sulfotransferase domain-containing protein n=1 Tax=Dendroctonus ponderosae TaxID=77166 RepID=A0AAR5P0F7_DENPD|nr:luciferin sulfotransferase [Dendroctonus ponderosae]KAH1009132.1 hypothetical protein HUJ04_001542 [Dendroctonus ponderosae]KAH1017084.1 hypothetical protein HUJ05_007802 [Dendroctonus ponderosae]
MPEKFILKAFTGKSDVNGLEKNEAVVGQTMLPPYYSQFSQRVLDAPVKEDDIWLVSYPRTGSTWCQEMIWLIQNNVDFQTCRSTLQQLRAPLIESSVVLFEHVGSITTETSKVPLPQYIKVDLPLSQLPSSMDELKVKLDLLFTDSVRFVEQLPSPRCIKSHLSIDLLPEQIWSVKPKIIYVMRNPKDLCVSYYFHCQLVHKFDVDFETFCELLLDDCLPIGSIFKHYLGYWNKRHDLNMLILRYEEMRLDTRGTVEKIANYLGKTLTEEQVDQICEFVSFNTMRNNKACNLQVLVDNKKGDDFYTKSGKHFVRKGIIGDYKNYMSPEMIARFDNWIEENIRGTDLELSLDAV